MAEQKLVPAKKTRADIYVVNSRFIATISPAFSVDEANAIIADIKEEFSDATHHVPAFIIGHGPSKIEHANDDGEPPGTAGRPSLAVLRGSGLGDAVVVVTRYFGGTKLGKGGLVRAYGDAVREVLKIVPFAVKVKTNLVKMVVPYPLFDRLRLLIGDYNGRVKNEHFAVEVEVIAEFPKTEYQDFQLALSELSHGKVSGEIIQTNRDSLFPIDRFK